MSSPTLKDQDKRQGSLGLKENPAYFAAERVAEAARKELVHAIEFLFLKAPLEIANLARRPVAVPALKDIIDVFFALTGERTVGAGRA